MNMDLSTLLDNAMASGSIWVYGMVLVGGILASFTPCTYPVLPLTIGYIGSQAGDRWGKGFALSLLLVLGMALVYAMVGILFAALGLQFGSLAGNGAAVFLIALFFMIMSLFLLDAFTLPIPKFMQRLQGGTRRKGMAGAFVVGCISGLVVGPCTGPILAIVIVAVTSTLEQATGAAYVLEILAGGLKLFLFGLGQGALILLCGSFTGLLSHLPKAGQWMVTLKKGFALLVLLGSSLLMVYVGQSTDFPLLTEYLISTDTQEATDTPSSNSTPSPFGGDEFLE